MSSGFLEIIKPLQNIAEVCASPIQYTPEKQNNKKIEYKQVRTWNKGLFQ